MNIQWKAYFLVFLMLVLSFSAGVGGPTTPLGEQSEQFVLTSPASVNAGGYQEGSIFTQSTVAIGAEHMCMILDNASVACWGEGADGQLGNNDTSYQSAPVHVSSFGPGRTATAITAGARHTCALLDNGSVSCWGNGEEGQLGNGALQSSSSGAGTPCPTRSPSCCCCCSAARGGRAWRGTWLAVASCRSP